MPQSPPLRLLVTTVALFLGVSALWWALGFQLGKGILGDLSGGGAFKRAYGFEQDNLVALLALCSGAVLAIALYEAAPAQARLLWLAAVALGTAFIMGGHPASLLGAGLTVFAAAAASETSGRQRLIASGAGAVISSFSFALTLGAEGGAWAGSWGLRAVFFFFPLVFGAAWLSEQLPRWMKSPRS